MAFKTEIVTSVAAFEALHEAWNALLDDMDFPEIFYRWEWTFLFFEHSRPHSELFIVVVRDQPSGEIVGIAPLCLTRVRRLAWSVRVAETIAYGIADYQNFMIRSGADRRRVVSAILDALEAHRARWDVADLQPFCTRDPATFQLLQAAQGRHDWTVRSHVTSYIATRRLQAGRIVEESPDQRQVRHVRNRLQTLLKGGMTFRVNSAAIDEAWPAFRALHCQAWPGSPLADPQYQAFIEALRSCPTMRDAIEFSLAEEDGRVVAAHFGFVDAGKIYYYMPAMDRAARHGRVGAALLYAIMEHHAASGRTFDFMRGLEPYKTWWADALDANLRIVVNRNSNLRALAYNLRDVVRRFLVEIGLPRALLRWLKRPVQAPP